MVGLLYWILCGSLIGWVASLALFPSTERDVRQCLALGLGGAVFSGMFLRAGSFSGASLDELWSPLALGLPASGAFAMVLLFGPSSPRVGALRLWLAARFEAATRREPSAERGVVRMPAREAAEARVHEAPAAA